MSGKFKNGVTVNFPNAGGVYKRLRIKAGPQRDRYVDQLILEAKLGRKLLPGMTVEHSNGNSLDVDPSNLLEVLRADNTRLMHVRRARAALAGAD